MRSVLLFGLGISAFVASACSALASTSRSALQVKGYQEEIDPPSSEKVQALYLTSRKVLDLPRELAREIRVIDLWHGKGWLKDGRCLQTKYDPASRQLIGASISEPGTCDEPSKYVVTLARPCLADQLTRPVRAWRIGCRRGEDGRSLLIAMRQDGTAHGGQEVLASIDLELLAVSAMGLHDQVTIRTLGLRSDGKTVLSDYFWDGRSTGSDTANKNQ
jgi:hypothetical protein